MTKDELNDDRGGHGGGHPGHGGGDQGDPGPSGGNGGGNEGHGHTVTIYVNTRAKEWPKEKISFEQLIKLAFENPPTGENIVFTVTYRNGPHNKPEGNLSPGESIKVKDGMIFDVYYTDKS